MNVSFLIKKSKKDKNNTVPIYCRISTSTFDRAEYYTKIRIDERLWLDTPKRDGSSGLTRYIKGTIDKIKAYNITLNKIEAKVQRKYNELREEGIPVTAAELKTSLLEGDTKLTIMGMLKKLKEKRKNKEAMDSYIKTIKDFLLKNYNAEDVVIQALAHKKYIDLGLRLEEWGQKKGWQKTYSKVLLDTIKSAASIAVKAGYIRENPVNYQIEIQGHEKKHKEHLNFNEVKALENFQPSKKSLERAKDVFLFQIYTGMAHIDVLSLQAEHITKGIDGRNWISKNREKTKQNFQVPIIAKAQAILDKYSGTKMRKSKLLPIVDISVYNKYLKKIMNEAGIEKSISTHCARHTLATLLAESGTDIKNIQRILGHINAEMTTHYSRLTPEILRNAMGNLETKMGIA